MREAREEIASRSARNGPRLGLSIPQCGHRPSSSLLLKTVIAAPVRAANKTAAQVTAAVACRLRNKVGLVRPAPLDFARGALSSVEGHGSNSLPAEARSAK